MTWATWEPGSGSEIVTYRPCDDVGESTCARIKKIAKAPVLVDLRNIYDPAEVRAKGFA